MNDWFSVDKEGLKALQKGKSKTFIINELVQNAWDENINECKVNINWHDGKVTLRVEDDSPEGFKDISHSYTLFADTYKRRDPTKRGRFNIGEKQVISICDSATVKTTKGTVIFDKRGRTETDDKTNAGSIIEVVFSATEDEASEIHLHTYKLLPPSNITFIVNGETLKSKLIYKTFDAKLLTENLSDGEMQRSIRNTKVDLVEHEDKSYLYEMGIPIMPIETPWHIDVQQKIPLNTDRTTVRPAFVQDIYAEALNVVYNDVCSADASQMWVRTASKDERVKKDAMKSVLVKRFGNKFVSKNPFDLNANDDALANGYSVVSGSQMSKEEWEKVKEMGLIQSSSDLFGKQDIATADPVEVNGTLKLWANFCKKCAKTFQGNEIRVVYVSSSKVNTRADYGRRTLRYNVALLPKNFFDKINKNNIDLLVHEIAHEKGNHTHINYHREITRLAGALTMKALNEPNFFTLGG